MVFFDGYDINNDMILADSDLKKAAKGGGLVIDPFDEGCVQPSSYDLHLLGEVRVFDNYEAAEIDVRKMMDVTRKVKIGSKGFVLHPGEFILGSTVERFEIPTDLAGILEGKSSLGRIGLIVHATAGFIDPGYKGQLTFDITNLSKMPIRIYKEMKIAQILFIRMTQKVGVAYGDKRLGSKYHGQKGPTASKMYLNFDKLEGR